jgi:hypothetical protein
MRFNIDSNLKNNEPLDLLEGSRFGTVDSTLFREAPLEFSEDEMPVEDLAADKPFDFSEDSFEFSEDGEDSEDFFDESSIFEYEAPPIDSEDTLSEDSVFGFEPITYDPEDDSSDFDDPIEFDSEKSEDVVRHPPITPKPKEETKKEYSFDYNFDGKLPGSDVDVNFADDTEEKETNWEDDHDPEKFADYLSETYPAKIPKHDGKSLSACERTLEFLKNLEKEISQAIRTDMKGVIPLDYVEKVRQRVIADTILLNNHVKKLKTKLRKTAGVIGPDLETAELIKEATAPRIQLVMTPFERAVAGIVINAVVSAGHAFEDVFEFLVKKYDLNEREQLAAMQLIMDMGFPIFKDRGTFGEKEGEEGSQGVEFIKNYFA